MDYWATDEASRKFVAHLGCDSLDEALRRLHVDRPHTLSGRYVGPSLPADMDAFGIRYLDIPYETGTYREAVGYPLASYRSVRQIEANYTWPSPDWWDYSHIRKEVAGHAEQIIFGGKSEPFLTYCRLRGMEQAFIDLVDNPDIVHYCLDRMFELSYQEALRIYEQAGPGNVHVTIVAEDMGSQTGLMFSPGQVREFLLPGMKRMIDLAHQAGARVFHHNDGAVREIIPMMIEAGIDILNPIQWRCAGMDRERLKRDFGEQVIFHGGVDNQQTLPFGTVEDVRREVIDNIRILGAGGGYILAPCHNIQAVSPPENVVAMYEAGYEFGEC